MNLEQLVPAIEASWSPDTTWTPERYPGRHPSTGHCAVTSVVLTEHVGGRLLGAWARDDGLPAPVRHYWVTRGGEALDLTRAQFGPGWKLGTGEPVLVQDLLANDWLRAKMNLFRRRVATAVGLGAELTDQQLEVLRLLGEGRSLPEVGVAMGISRHTAADHVKRIYERLGVNSRAQAGIAAYVRGLV